MSTALYILLAEGVYFVVAAAVALALATRRDFRGHRRWVIRHVAAGIWVAPQRIYLGFKRGQTPEQKIAAFFDGAMLSVLFTVCAAEAYLIYTDHKTCSSKND
jgi:hypothetical protein